MGQPQCHIQQVQCYELITTQSLRHMFQPRTVRRTETDPRSLITMQISNLGHQQNENKNKCSQKQQKQQPRQQAHM